MMGFCVSSQALSVWESGRRWQCGRMQRKEQMNELCPFLSQQYSLHQELLEPLFPQPSRSQGGNEIWGGRYLPVQGLQGVLAKAGSLPAPLQLPRL